MVDRKRTCSHATGVAIHTLVARGKRGPSEYLRMTGSPATSLAGEDQIDPPIELLEWQAAVFDRHPAVVVHVIEGLADGLPSCFANTGTPDSSTRSNIVFVRKPDTSDGVGCNHVLVKLPDGSYYDGGAAAPRFDDRSCSDSNGTGA